jgi:hypothetical protein
MEIHQDMAVAVSVEARIVGSMEVMWRLRRRLPLYSTEGGNVPGGCNCMGAPLEITISPFEI